MVYWLHFTIDPNMYGNTRYNDATAYGQTTLPQGIRSRFVDNNNGCRMHLLEAGFEEPGRPCVVLLHGFPELAYSWRKQLLPFARAGFHVIAPDQRGYGRSSGTEVSFDDDLSPFTLLNHVSDTLGLVRALGFKDVAAVVGHDYGSPVAAWCGLTRPDVFRSVVLLSAPFAGVPPLPVNTATGKQVQPPGSPETIFDELSLLPVPRKHYQKYYATREANQEMWNAPGGVHGFLRAYYHVKSADWKPNTPFPLEARTAEEWAKLPRYYVMALGKGMPETVAPEMPSPEEVAACEWLTDEELSVYSAEYARTGFQGALQSYRVKWIAALTPELSLFAGRSLDVPSLFVAGERDWGVHQTPGAFDSMKRSACSDFRGAHLIANAGHWVQQEEPAEVNRLLIQFLRDQEAPYPMPDRFPIEGQHVSLRPLSLSHVEPLWRIIQGQPPELFHHLFFGPFGTEGEVEEWIRRVNRAPKTVPLAIFGKRSESYVGSCSLINIDLKNGAAEIGGIWCSVAEQGTEVVSATTFTLLEYLLQDLGYRRVVWKCDQTNHASRRAAEQMGFTYEGTFRNHLFIRGRSRDTAWYSVVDSDWPEVRARLSERIEKKRSRSPR